MQNTRGCLKKGDVSVGNMLRPPAPLRKDKDFHTLVPITSGALIDLDHAEYTTVSTKLGKSVPSPALVQGLIQAARLSGHDIREDVMSQCLKLLPKIQDRETYIHEATTRNVRNSKPNGPWSARDLGWKDIVQRPDFTSQRSSVNDRTGTLPFISHQLIVPRKNIIHEAIHDLESFWWIMIYLCLTQESRGGCKRKNAADELRDLVTSLFETDGKIIAYDKSTYFNTKTDRPLETLLRHFQAYFDPLKSMLRRWRDVLILGYTFEAYEYYHIHDFVIEVINDALRGLSENTNGPSLIIFPAPYGTPPSSPIRVA